MKFKLFISLEVRVCQAPLVDMSLSLQSSLFGQFLWLIKRTYQPSKLRRNRKVGFLGRLETKVEKGWDC